MKIWLALAAAVWSVGCLDPDLSGTRDAVVIAANDSGEYALRTRSVTADDFTTLDGESVRFVSRPSLEIDLSTETVTAEGGDDMHVSYAEHDGALVATDYLGIVAITTYRHMSHSHEYFRALGLGTDVEDMPQQRVMFLPTLRVSGQAGRVPANDNMAFIPQLEAFMVLAEDQLDRIPLAANEGVVAHEFSHAVLNHLTDDASGLPPDQALGWDSASTNYWRSLHEGLADVHGAGLTGHSNFISASVGLEFGDRDLASDHVLDEFLISEAESFFEYDPYPMGSVLAATFWTYRGELVDGGADPDQAQASMARLAFSGVLSLELTSSFHLADYLSAVAGAAPNATERDAWCAAVGYHFAIIAAQVGGCP